MIAVRDATPDDYDDYARLFPELSVDDPVPARDFFVAELAPRTVTAVDGGATVGYALYEVMGTLGYVRNVVTDPAHRRRGVGAALMADLRARCLAAGARTWALNVKPDNVAAVTLYERCGMTTAYRTHVMRIAADHPLAPAPPDVTLAPADPADDAVLEARFGIPGGQLTSARGRASREVLVIRRGADVVGACTWMPHVPGAFPFRLADPSLAGAVASLLRARTPPDKPWLQLTAEDDELLHRAVMALGARLEIELLHLRGSL
jgi:ribosomal protein S18 acetylase RimI-like enzyme